jgi:cytochrome c oxidase subunit II
LFVVTGGFALAGCSGPLSTLDPAGPSAAAIATLWWIMLAGATLLFVLVLALLFAGFVRPGLGRGISPRVWLVGGGLVLPAFVLTPLMVVGLWSGEKLLFRGETPAVTIDVTARQFEWQFSYRNEDGTSAHSLNVLHLPAAMPVRLEVRSDDVIHSFWVPRLAGKIDAIPGHTNVIVLSADAAGTYRGACAEFCGRDHTAMLMEVQVHENEARFRDAIRALAPAASPAMSPGTAIPETQP